MDSITAPHRENNFDTMRLLAALAVVASHSVPLTYGPQKLDFLWSFSHGRATLGSVAIQVFFIISGYLITASYLHSQNVTKFIVSRALRLIPALVVVLALLAFLLGPLLTTLPLQQYFHSTLPYRAVLGLSDHLPGVFTNNPFSSGIDGSLWTLRYEALCYLAVLLLGLAGRLRLNTILPLYLILLAARLHYGSHPALEFATLFAAGSILRLLRPPLHKTLALVCAVLWLLSLKFGGFTFISDTAGAYLVIYLGLAAPKFIDLAKQGDLSYGVYIYAWPIQQTLVLLLGQQISWLGNLGLAAPLSLACAWLSWHVIEAPALRQKNRFRTAHRRIPQTAP